MYNSSWYFLDSASSMMFGAKRDEVMLHIMQNWWFMCIMKSELYYNSTHLTDIMNYHEPLCTDDDLGPWQGRRHNVGNISRKQHSQNAARLHHNRCLWSAACRYSPNSSHPLHATPPSLTHLFIIFLSTGTILTANIS